MKNQRITALDTRRLTVSALMAAITCIATMIIKIPVPATGGYINFGDGAVILSGFMLGPLYGGAAAGIGSALADIFSGYAIYAPATFIIKAVMAAAASFIIRKSSKASIVRLLTAGVVCEIIMAAGYLSFEAFILGYGTGALAAVVGNIIQGVCGIIVSAILVPAVGKLNSKAIYSSNTE